MSAHVLLNLLNIIELRKRDNMGGLWLAEHFIALLQCV